MVSDTPWRSKVNCLTVEPGGCCYIEMAWSQIMGRQGTHEGRMDHCRPRRSALWGLLGLMGLSEGPQRPQLTVYSIRSVPQGEKVVIDGHREYRAIIPGQRSCKSKELNKKPLKNSQNAPTRKESTATPCQPLPEIPALRIARFSQVAMLFWPLPERTHRWHRRAERKERTDGPQTPFPLKACEAAQGCRRGDGLTLTSSLDFWLLCETENILSF